MTEIIENTDIDLTLLFDFEKEVVCESVLGCDNTAEWVCKWSHCCGTKILLCQKCKDICEKSDLADLATTCGWCLSKTKPEYIKL